MAILSVCAKLLAGFDASCEVPARKYEQQAVLINRSSIESYTITKPDGANCNYNVEFTLKAGETGHRFIGPEAGSNFYGSHDKSRSDLGFPQYTHNANVLIIGATENAKCVLDSLDKGSFVVAMQLKDGTIEIFGMVNGLTTGDYTYNLQEGGGGTAIMLSSLEDAPENLLPLVYKPAEGGNAIADFDASFAPQV